MNYDDLADLEHRHPGTTGLMRWFAFEHLPEGEVRGTSAQCYVLARVMVRSLPDGPELTAGLRHLLEAKDCFVRAALAVHLDERSTRTTPKSSARDCDR